MMLFKQTNVEKVPDVSSDVLDDEVGSNGNNVENRFLRQPQQQQQSGNKRRFCIIWGTVATISLVAIVTTLVMLLSPGYDDYGGHDFDYEAGAFAYPILEPEYSYTMPAEDTLHEGTWLVWPHDFGWDEHHVERYEATWVAMTKALHTDETVHIIAYDSFEQDRIREVLENEAIDMGRIHFVLAPTDDVWVRDTGAIFVRGDTDNETYTLNWRFNGWGYKSDFWNDHCVPDHMSRALGMPIESVPMVMEGGSFEVDGFGTLMAKKSSILNKNRNPGWTQSDAERYFSHYLGVENFIWLEGEAGYEITDDHIDGSARFANGNTIVTMARDGFYLKADYDRLVQAQNAKGEPYQLVHLPQTRRKLRGLGERGIYVNYYVGNAVVLVPRYNDPNDKVAAEIIQGVYPDKRIVGIDIVSLFEDGGMIHCVTQQQPVI